MICAKHFKDSTDICLINKDRRCGHEFHKECIKYYINEKCKQILVKKVLCPVKKCHSAISLTQALKILDDADDILRFEWNDYLWKLFQNKKINTLKVGRPDWNSAKGKLKQKTNFKNKNSTEWIDKIKKLNLCSMRDFKSFQTKFNTIFKELEGLLKRCDKCKLPYNRAGKLFENKKCRWNS